MRILMSFSISFIFGLFLIENTIQLVKERIFRYDRKDYIIATMNIYIDFIGFFVAILEFIEDNPKNRGKSKSNPQIHIK